MLNTKQQQEYLQLRKKIIEKCFAKMNDRQREGVFRVNGPVLILAGAGSGKTTVIVNRIANIIRFGDGYNSKKIPDFINPKHLELLNDFLSDNIVTEEEKLEVYRLCADRPAPPYSILAITFTNKAAKELKERLCSMLGSAGEDIWANTFHSVCVRILRRDIDKIGYSSNFTIYDTSDSLRTIKACLKEMNVDEKYFPPKMILSTISKSKNKLQGYEDFIKDGNANDYRHKTIGECFRLYQKKLLEANALDFDDIIKLTVRLFDSCPDVISYYRNKFRYIMVDEYQDTNMAQFAFVSRLCTEHQNLCVVGDDDQSIYAFRGADITNILNFEKQFPTVKTIRLEQNYRSTKTILQAANDVIGQNRERKRKTLWTENEYGKSIVLFNAQNENEEAMYITDTIHNLVSKQGAKYQDIAILYRMNAQSAILERGFTKSGIPHRIIGGNRFYDRKEVKDILAYLSVLINPHDEGRLLRIINEPKRGIGNATVEACRIAAYENNMSMYETLSISNMLPQLQRSSPRLIAFYDMMEKLKVQMHTMPLDKFVEFVMYETGYIPMLEKIGDNEAQGRIENLLELISNVISYQSETENPTLEEFIEEVTLLSDIDNHDQSAEAVSLMTVHSAKGLEFPYVFIYGMEEGIFPSFMSMDSESGLEEERRLCYVALTRAKKQLFITISKQRMMFGKTTYNRPSKFLKEISDDIIEIKENIYNPLQFTSRNNNSVSTENKKTIPHHSSFLMPSNSANKSANKKISYKTGEMVEHNSFGRGMIISVKEMSGDVYLEVAFDKVGTKKLMANFVRLKKLDS
jgi:DNA helicase-2/ATP-dependent DNA helicase PcrA